LRQSPNLMKHIYLLLFVCFAIQSSNAQDVNIPDSNLKWYFLQVADLNNDGEIQVSEAEYFSDPMEVYTENIDDEIYDLTGLEAFINSTSCEITNYVGTTLDLSPYQQFTAFGIYTNTLTSIDLSQNVNLEYFSMTDTQIASLDLSSNINLKGLFLPNNQLTDINFPDDVDLFELDLYNNQLTSLDLRNMGFINGVVDVANNQLSSLYFNDNQLGGELYASNNQFVSLDLSKTYFYLLFIGNNYHLQYLNVKQADGDRITSIYANGCPNLAVVCVPYEGFAPTQDDLYANQSSNVLFTEDCSISSDNFNIIDGTISFDNEADGCDANDFGMESILVQTTDGTDTFVTSTNENGIYQQLALEGTYTVSLTGLADYYNYTPLTQSATITGFNNVETLDFCITSTQTINDVNITLIPTSQARPGFNATYQLVYKNVGTTTLSGDVTLQFDETMQTFVSASPAEDMSTVNSVTFNYTNLEPFESREIDIVLNTMTPPTVNGDDILILTTSITPETGDNTPTDNSYTLNQVVVNSYDPNDKQVLQGAEILEEQTDEDLDYLIRFQNTGTASAINVSVTDELDDKLDWDTFQMVSTSHPYKVNITNGNFVQFVFDGINLPAEQDNEPASHGFIAFKIKPKTDVVIGDIITGLSKIYFDFNAPIITNSVSTEVVNESLSISENQIETSINLYPNPTNNQFKVVVTNGTSIKTIKLISISGKSLKSFDASESYNISDLASGIYFIKIKTNKGEINKRIVKK